MNEGANIAMVTEEQKQVNTLQYGGSDTDENGIPNVCHTSCMLGGQSD